MTRDVFRPHWSPAREIYDAFVNESKKRPSRDMDDWIRLEREAVWDAVNRERAKLGKGPIPIASIEDAENSAMGHTDYGAKWAYRCAELVEEIK